MDRVENAVEDELNPTGGEPEGDGFNDENLELPPDVHVDDDLLIHIPADDDAPRPGDDLDPDDAP